MDFFDSVIYMYLDVCKQKSERKKSEIFGWQNYRVLSGFKSRQILKSDVRQKSAFNF